MYIVTAPLVVVAVSDSRREVYLARGRTVPDTITDASLAHLLGRGLIASKEQPETETPDAPDTPDVPEQPVEPVQEGRHPGRDPGRPGRVTTGRGRK